MLLICITCKNDVLLSLLHIYDDVKLLTSKQLNRKQMRLPTE